MQIRGFQQQDIASATLLADKIWEDEYVNYSPNFAKTMAEYIIRCSFLNENLAFKIEENGLFKGCILGARKNDKGTYAQWLAAQFSAMNAEELARAQAMHAYFSNISAKVHEYMQADDLYLGLFVSNQAGGGKLLMQALLEAAKKEGLKAMYLWTDTTCDFDYYEKHNYTLVAEISNAHLQNDYATYTTYIYKKSLV